MFVLKFDSGVNLSQVTILRKIHGNSLESFLGIRENSQESFSGNSGKNVDSYSEEFLVTLSKKFLVTNSRKFLVTNSEEILITLSKEFLVTNSRKFLVTNSAEKPEKMLTKFVEILWNFQRKVLQNQFQGISWELFPRFSQEFLRNILKYSWVNSLTRT